MGDRPHRQLVTLFVAGLLGLAVSASSLLAEPPCTGDCDGNTSVTVDEILTMVNIALGTADRALCTAGDTNHDNNTTIDEILGAVNNALNGCVSIPSPTPTELAPTATATETPTTPVPSINWEIRGVALNNYWETGNIDSAADWGRNEIGANWASVLVTWYQGKYEDSAVSAYLPTQPLPFPCGYQTSPTEESIRAYITTLKGLGYKVMLRPHIDLTHQCASPGQYAWRGNINPTDKIAWFTRYRDFIMMYAHVAKDLHVDLLSIGSELKMLSTDPSLKSLWHNLVQDIRNLYQEDPPWPDGKLTYACTFRNRSNAGPWECELIDPDFWSDLDYVGVNIYPYVSTAQVPACSDLSTALTPFAALVQAIHAPRPIIFTEFGFRTQEYCADQPRAAARNDVCQARAYESFLKTFRDLPGLAGGFVWEEIFDHDCIGACNTDLNDDRFSPRDNPAGEVLKRYYKGEATVSACAD